MSSHSLLISEGPSLAATFQDGSIHLEIRHKPGFLCSNMPSDWIEWFQSYCQKKPAPLPQLPLDHLTPFTQKVLIQLCSIPLGHQKSYSEIANSIAKPKAQRAVGTACGKNPYPIFIPCHRVVGSQGLGGFSAGLEVKKRLLAHECGTDFAYLLTKRCDAPLNRRETNDRNRDPKANCRARVYP